MKKRDAKRATLPPERWEVGGEFHWMGLPPAPFIPWPQAASWYLLGRHALAALLQFLPQGSRRLWLPSYFCFDVADYWRSFVEVATYHDDPRRAEPDWSTLFPAAADIVIAVNFFGVRSDETWRLWRERNSCVLVEDHSHDPVSGWALRSNADYAFASLRKTVPVPDGAIIWSPRGLPLPPSGTAQHAGSAMKLAAMLWKAEYLEGHTALSAKPVYLKWQRAGEHAFDHSQVCFVTDLSQQYVCAGVPLIWHRRRSTNATFLLSKLRGARKLRPIFTNWPDEAAPLGVVVEFESEADRDAIRLKLKEHGVYCSVHWPAAKGCSSMARDLARLLLTLPTDQRYGRNYMERIAGLILDR
ncbi:MAG TPA: hypothetical protein VII23_23130 [Terriglobales bacterium]